MQRKIFIGVDVGKDGALFGMDQDRNVLIKKAIPKVKGKQTEVDYDLLLAHIEEFKGLDVIVAIEDVHSLYGMSAKSNFSFGHIKGFKEAMFKAIGAEVTLVQPKKWQQGVWIEDDVVFEKGKKKDTKATSLKAAKRIFPEVDWRKSKRATTPHDGIVDAALICEYLIRRYERK